MVKWKKRKSENPQHQFFDWTITLRQFRTIAKANVPQRGKLPQSCKGVSEFSLPKHRQRFSHSSISYITLSLLKSPVRGVRCCYLYTKQSRVYNHHHQYLPSWINQQLYTQHSLWSIQLLSLIQMDRVEHNEINSNERSCPIPVWNAKHRRNNYY